MAPGAQLRTLCAHVSGCVIPLRTTPCTSCHTWAVRCRPTKALRLLGCACGCCIHAVPQCRSRRHRTVTEPYAAGSLCAQAATDITHSIVRPTAFFKSVAGQVQLVKDGAPFVMFGDGKLAACKPISEANLASFIADCVTQRDKVCTCMHMRACAFVHALLTMCVCTCVLALVCACARFVVSSWACLAFWTGVSRGPSQDFRKHTCKRM